MKSIRKIDKTFILALGVIMGFSVYTHILKTANAKLRQENLYYQRKINYMDAYGVAMEKCLWGIGEKKAMQDYKLYAFEDDEKNFFDFPVDKLIINCSFLKDSSLYRNNMLEILRICGDIPHLQVIVDSCDFSSVQALLKNNKSCRIWGLQNRGKCLQHPSVFLVDRAGNRYCNFMIYPQTIHLFIRYLRFIQDQHFLE